ncbi:MAG: hypothetical protein R3F54_02220 [Alphaproteobacteria bacterium]
MIVKKIGMTLDEAVDLGLNSLHQHLPSTLAQQTKRRVILDDPAWSRQADNGIVLHGGRILSNGDFSNHRGYAAKTLIHQIQL